MKREFSRQILEKNILIPNFMNVRPEGAQLFHAAGHDEVDIRFSEFNEGA